MREFSRLEMDFFGLYSTAINCFRFKYWLPPRDSNPDMPLQRRLSYH
jgi:hypothetical protein